MSQQMTVSHPVGQAYFLGVPAGKSHPLWRRLTRTIRSAQVFLDAVVHSAVPMLWLPLFVAMCIRMVMVAPSVSPLECIGWGTAGLIPAFLGLRTRERDRGAHAREIGELRERLMRQEGNYARALTSLGDLTSYILQSVEKATAGIREPAIIELRASLRQLRTNALFSQMAVVDVDCCWSHEDGDKLQACIYVHNGTRNDIRVGAPVQWEGAQRPCVQGGRIASTMQLRGRDGSWLPHQADELTVPAGCMFRFWVDFDPAIGLEGLRGLQSSNRLGIFTLPVSIAGWQYELRGAL
jgi:hypothetical protein